MRKHFLTHSAVPGLLVALIILAGCRGPRAEEPTPGEQVTLSLLEQRLLRVIELEEQLEEVASQPDADYGEVQRRFQEVAGEYHGIIVRNPDDLNARLLYAKLLSRYGDRDTAWEQFITAAKLAENEDRQIAVIHQELSTYYAEEGDHTRAIAYALNAIDIEPETAAYHFGLGQVLAAFKPEFMADGIYSSARIDEMMLRAFATARDLQPNDPDLQFRYGEAFYDVEDPDWENALAHWEQLAAFPGLSPFQQDAILLHKARCLAGLGRSDEARQLADSVQSPELQESVKALF
ncbi:MAG: tetratricopeptide repeat protein [Puniceicoccaceae bacterium]